MGEARKKRDSLLSSRAAALVSCVSLDARARAFPSLNLKKKRDCLHSNPPAVFTTPRQVRSSKRLKEIDQIDHFICVRIKKIVFISKTSHTLLRFKTEAWDNLELADKRNQTNNTNWIEENQLVIYNLCWGFEQIQLAVRAGIEPRVFGL